MLSELLDWTRLRKECQTLVHTILFGREDDNSFQTHVLLFRFLRINARDMPFA